MAEKAKDVAVPGSSAAASSGTGPSGAAAEKAKHVGSTRLVRGCFVRTRNVAGLVHEPLPKQWTAFPDSALEVRAVHLLRRNPESWEFRCPTRNESIHIDYQESDTMDTLKVQLQEELGHPWCVRHTECVVVPSRASLPKFENKKASRRVNADCMCPRIRIRAPQ